MSFYEQISKYYDFIFPAGQSQLKFIKESAGTPPKDILDVACGSGGYSLELGKAGYNITAVDLDDKMVSMTKEKAAAEKIGINAMKADMRELKQTLGENATASFGCIFCIGNSIAHLESLAEITKALRQMYELLSDSGVLVLQIINYDRIVKFHINELPPVRNDEVGLKFIRKYEYVEDRGIINFNTVLTIENKEASEKYENSIELLPIHSENMETALLDAGFDNIEFYGDFNHSPYNEDSFMLVVKAKRFL